MLSHVPLHSAQDAAIQCEMSQSFNSDPLLKDLERVPHVLDKDIGTQSSSNISILLEHDPVTPLVLSPTSSVSTPSSPNIGGFIWDIPETPARQPYNQGNNSPLTPLTPPVVSDDLGQACKSQVKSSFFPNNVVTRDADSGKVNPQFVHTTTVPHENTSEKIFHGLSDIFATTTNEHSNLQTRYNYLPSIDLFPKTQSNSKDKRVHKRESKATGHEVKIGNTDTTSALTDTPRFRCTNREFQKVLEHIVPSEIHSRMKDTQEICVASKSKKPNERCTKLKSRGQLSSAQEILESVSNCIKKSNYAALPEFLERLVKVVTCMTHTNVALHLPKAKPRMDTLRYFIVNLSKASESQITAFKAWTAGLAKLDPPSVGYSLPELSLAAIPSKTSSDIITSSLPDFLPYKTVRLSDSDILKNLKKKINDPLEKTDMTNGYIYIFWDPGNFGMVKIGRTNDLERRLKEWNKCKSTHTYHASSRKRELPEVPHVQRIEKLIHIELINKRRKRSCSNCKANMHEEWFEVSEEKVKEIFQKWRSWILQEPYAEADDEKWYLKPGMLETLPELCELEPITKKGPNNFIA